MLIFTEIFNKFFYQKTITFQKKQKENAKRRLKKGKLLRGIF